MDAKYFFNSNAFLTRQGNPQVLELQSDLSAVRLAWIEINREGYSPYKAPFGSIEVHGPFAPQLTSQLLEDLDRAAAERKWRTFRITQPPDGYDSESMLLVSKALLQDGFQLVHQDLNFHLPIGLDFKSHLHRSERYKLNKLKRAGFRFGKLAVSDWHRAYELLQNSRIRKGFSLSMSKDALEQTIAYFPAEYQIFGVWMGDQLAAMSVAIAVNSQILYVFYTADDMQFRKFSPVVLLHEGLYEFGLANQFQLLDLGTASLKGLVNSGVANFKRNLGGIASLKNSFQKRY